MTEVLINNKTAVIKDGSSLKLTIENTFFEDSGAYTLDVTFPLYIEQNRSIFGNINRLEVSKSQASYDAEIRVDNKVVFHGSAKVTNITDEEIKLQFLSGNSRVRFWTKAKNMYIDEFRYQFNPLDYIKPYPIAIGIPGEWISPGNFPGIKGVYCYVPMLVENEDTPTSELGWPGKVLNWQALAIQKDDYETIIKTGDRDGLQNNLYTIFYESSICPNLMYITRCIFKELGYTIRKNDIESEFINSIYIASGRQTRPDWYDLSEYVYKPDEMSRALPHWTVEEFIKQLQYFFNVKIIFDDITSTVDIAATIYTDNMVDLTHDVIDAYDVDIIDDEDVDANLYDSNVVYKKSESEYHGTSMIEHEIISSFDESICSKGQALREWDAMDENKRKATVWTTPQGHFCADDNGNMVRFNIFGAIVRNKDNDNEIELKISPVATTAEIRMPVYRYYSDSVLGRNITVYDKKKTGKSFYVTTVCLQNQFQAANKPTVWDAITDNIEQATEKEDIMQVFIMDDIPIRIDFYSIPFQMPYTHCNYNTPDIYTMAVRNSWSLALANDNSECNIGKYHQAARKQNRNTEHHIKFRATSIPSVYSVFHIRNKIYACKKLEVSFTSKGMDEIISGYFEEIIN